MKTTQLMKSPYSQAAADKLVKGISDEDWNVAPLPDMAPLNGFPLVPLVAAGDGGMWVPVYVYVTKEEASK